MVEIVAEAMPAVMSSVVVARGFDLRDHLEPVALKFTDRLTGPQAFYIKISESEHTNLFQGVYLPLPILLSKN